MSCQSRIQILSLLHINNSDLRVSESETFNALVSEGDRSTAKVFDTWGRENLADQKHRWFQDLERGDQDVASLEFKRRGG